MKTDIDNIKLVGARKKNGHKIDCSCHICENMKNKAKRGGYTEELEKEEEKKLGGSNKKNGHKKKCSCVICKNMMNIKIRTTKNTKKKNGHKLYCKCPICKNMNKNINKNNPILGGNGTEMGNLTEYEMQKETEATDEDYDNIENIKEDETKNENINDNKNGENKIIIGGKRKTKTKKIRKNKKNRKSRKQ